MSVYFREYAKLVDDAMRALADIFSDIAARLDYARKCGKLDKCVLYALRCYQAAERMKVRANGQRLRRFVGRKSKRLPGLRYWESRLSDG